MNDSQTHFSYRWLSNIGELSATTWQAFFADNPFTDHGFLLALEQSGCVSEATGWQPKHLVIYQDDRIVALAPGYLKTHSYGEYVFDWAWAEAYEKNALDYYPKWVSGSPFSPVEGPRIAIKHTNPALIYNYISQLLDEQCQTHGWSGWHINFCDQQQAKALNEHSAMLRLGVQFQWFNRSYTHFDDFLQQLMARKRKAIKKERAKITQQNITIQWLQGEQITSSVVEQFCEFYQRTYLKRSGHLGYLNPQFFSLLQHLMAEKIVIMQAKQNDQLIAATLSFIDGDTLYGRYWGANAEVDCLHFELCYYQGIEYCIKHNLKCFHSGAQGEHKISRGFESVFTYSAHAIAHPEFRLAIADFLQRESSHLKIYQQQCQTLLPFKHQ